MKEKRMSDDVELYLASDEPVKASDMPITNEEKPTPKTTEEKKDKKPKAVRMGEIPEFRGRNKKRFRMSDGTEQDVFYASDVHALDAKTGRFEEIEDTLTEDEDGKHLVCGRHSFVAKFSNDESTDEIFSIEQGAHKVTVLAKKSSKTKKKGRKPDVRKRDFDTQSESKIVSFSEIEADAVYEYTVEPLGVKENILIKSPKEAYKYPFILKCENVKAVFDAEQMTVSFKDLLTEEDVFYIPAPFMKDNNGAVSKAVHYALSEKKNGDAVLTVIADSEWMNDKARVFPVVIDPQIFVPKSRCLNSYSWDSDNPILTSKESHRVGIVQHLIRYCDDPCVEFDFSHIHNNGWDDAIEFTYGQRIVGSIENAGDFVWYKYIADGDSAYPGNPIGNYTFYTSGNVDTKGELYDEYGTPIASNDDGDGLGYNFSISADLICGQAYYLKVFAHGSGTSGVFHVNCERTDKFCQAEDANNPTYGYLYTRHRMYMKLNRLDLPQNARIKKATLVLHAIESDTNYPFGRMGLYHVSDDLCGDYYYEPNLGGDLIDYELVSTSGVFHNVYNFDITSLVASSEEWKPDYYNFVLKYIDESDMPNNNITIAGAEDRNYAPYIEVKYEADYAVNTSRPSHTHSIGKFGQAAIDLKYGTLTFDSTDFAWAGNRMPVTIKHLYNSLLCDKPYTQSHISSLADFSGMKVGNGFRLNLMQSVIADGDDFIYTDENGEETRLTHVNECIYKNEEADISYEADKFVLTIGDEKRTFEDGRLKKIEVGNGDNNVNSNVNEITYTDGRITFVTDGAGRSFTFKYCEGYLEEIVAPDGTSMSYTYSDERLTAITYPDNSHAEIVYNSDGLPSEILLIDACNYAVYKIAYTYEGFRVRSVCEYGAENGAFIQGAQSTFWYSLASNRTEVVTSEPGECGECGNEFTTVYTFDSEGNIASNYVYATDIGKIGVNGTASGIHPYSEDGGASTIPCNTNLLYNHTFTKAISIDPDTEAEIITENWIATNDACPPNKRVPADNFRQYAMEICTKEECDNNSVYQQTVSLPAGEYTFSAYVKATVPFKNTSEGVFIRVSDLGGNTLAVSEKLASTDMQYIRLIAPFELGVTQSVKVEFVLNGVGTVHVCAPQLENNPFANEYNMLHNGNFELGSTDWTGGMTDTTECFNMSKSMHLIGDVSQACYCCQDIYPFTADNVRETFTLSGWAKGKGLPMHERVDSENPTFRLRAEIVYDNDAIENHTADFSPCTDKWQFASVQFSKSEYRTIKRLTIYCDYDHNNGDVYFDDIQLVRNSIETDLAVGDFSGTSANDITSDETTSTEADGSKDVPVFTEATDVYGNALTETTFTDGEFGTIYRSFAYTENGNDLIRETDARGNVTTYEVEASTSRNKEVTDRCGNKTAYEYDNSGRTTKVTSKNADGTELAHVSYAYDTFDNMTEIVRGDGMKYALAYNEFHNLASIGIEGKAEKLIQYTYKNGNGRLKEMKYANGHTMKATYNAFGQMVDEKWFESEAAASSNATPIAHYKYVYDGNGNIVRSIDITAQKEYNYTYEDGRIVRATEVKIIEDKDQHPKQIVNTIRYYYDTEGKMTKKVITPASGSAQTIYYETSDDNTVVKFSAGGRTVTSHSKTDSFGRKVFDELQLGTDFVSRQFVYHAGQVTDAHKENEKVKSSATTQLVSQILLSDGRTLSYEYDNEERIVKVTDSIDGITEYTYDALGQLLTETVNDEVINSMEYDNYGNITKKNGIVYNYSYSTWKDLLTSYNGQTISYDAQGNPTTYLGHTLEWEKGRQLKKFVKSDGTVIDYTYNANGIRTSKIVNGIKHEYTLDGTKILRETWGGNTLIPLYDNEDSVCGIIHNDIPYYFIKNLQGDVIAIVDKDAQTVARYSYDAWGVPEVKFDSSDCQIATVNPFRYRGYYYDEEIGLYYLQSRYYDACVGRFINGDDGDYVTVVDETVTFNLYTYCNNEPISNADFTGKSLTAILIGVAIGAIVGGLAGYGLSRILKVPKGSRWKYVLGGAVIGAIIGGCIGYAVGAAGSSGIVLWSGGGMNGAGGHAMNFATKNGLRTLEMTTKGKFLSKMNAAAIKILGKSKGYKFMKPFWNAASKQFVKSAAGRQTYVNVFISVSQFSEASVFAKIEYEIVRSLGLKIIWHFVQ